MTTKWHQSQNDAKMIPNDPKEIPKWSQANATCKQWSQNGPKLIPKWSPNDPEMMTDTKMIPKWSRTDPQNGTRLKVCNCQLKTTQEAEQAAASEGDRAIGTMLKVCNCQQKQPRRLEPPAIPNWCQMQKQNPDTIASRSHNDSQMIHKWSPNDTEMSSKY